MCLSIDIKFYFSIIIFQMYSWLSTHPVVKPIMVISGLCYLIAVVVGNMLFDLLGNVEPTRMYYCSLQAAGWANPFRSAPLLGAVVVTVIGLGLKARASFATKMDSPMFLLELSLLSALCFVGLPLFGKCMQLQIQACAHPPGPTGYWPVHQNLLMAHMCIFLILLGGVSSQALILLTETKDLQPRGK